MYSCGRGLPSWPSQPLIQPGFPNPQAFFCACKSTVNSPEQTTSSLQTRSDGRRWSERQWYNPLGRLWIDADHRPIASSSQERITVVSYNILGDRNAFNHRDLYLEVPSAYLNWDYRRRLICEELTGYDCDVICLQCVHSYDRRWIGTLIYSKSCRKLGMRVPIRGVLGIRLTDVLCSGKLISKEVKLIWIALFSCDLSSKRFACGGRLRLLEGESIEFKQLGLRDNVAQIFVFESVISSILYMSDFLVYRQTSEAESRRIVIGNIHVIYRPSRGDVKLGQIRFLSSRAQYLSEKWGNVPVILTGDFNSTPQLNVKLHDRKNLSGQRNFHPTEVFGAKREAGSPFVLIDRFLESSWTAEEVEAATGHSNRDFAKHPLKLCSSYATVHGSKTTRDLSGEPLATSFHSKFVGTVDYLWHSSGIQATGVLDTLPLDFLKRIGGLPCKKLGSDHLALVSEFAFTEVTKEAIETD
ncbi:unnamed protein product [Linum tenue]|uniref:Endonuclease/exonuclease/phosphatase domain-containing protein n=1 Tax=Linum tenue TaxID=586396 RepID=A0AAV0PHM9_9ROSI|nr:unnamed protein product [Linum tenue]